MPPHSVDLSTSSPATPPQSQGVLFSSSQIIQKLFAQVFPPASVIILSSLTIREQLATAIRERDEARDLFFAAQAALTKARRDHLSRVAELKTSPNVQIKLSLQQIESDFQTTEADLLARLEQAQATLAAKEAQVAALKHVLASQQKPKTSTKATSRNEGAPHPRYYSGSPPPSTKRAQIVIFLLMIQILTSGKGSSARAMEKQRLIEAKKRIIAQQIAALQIAEQELREEQLRQSYLRAARARA